MSPEQLLGQVEARGRFVIADMEAGVGNLARMSASALDLILVIVEPTPKSIDVARRARDLAKERSVGPVRFVANRVRDDVDRALLLSSLGVIGTEIPEDEAILNADRDGRSPVDADADAPAVRAMIALARDLARAGPARPHAS